MRAPDKTAAERLMALFSGSERAHGTHGDPIPAGGRCWWVK